MARQYIAETAEATGKKPFLELSSREWLWPIVFMLGMSMVGLRFPLGYLVILASLLHAFMHDRYNFVIMITIYCGGYSLATHEETFASRTLLAGVCLAFLLVLRKSPALTKVMVAFFAYWACLCVFAYMGVTGFFSQFGPMVNHLSVIWFVIPLAAFSGRSFDMRVFFRRTFPFALIAAIYYFLDGFVMGGQFFLPRDPMWSQTFAPTFYNFRVHILSFEFMRRWQPAMYLLILSLYPTMMYYRLRPWMWFMVAFSCYISRTFSVLLGFIIAALIVFEKKRQVFRMTLVAVAALTVLYFVDGALGEASENGSTTLRIKSQIDQLTGLSALNGDEEAIAELGTGRGGQILPALEMMSDYGREWKGFGFLSEDATPHQYYYDSEFIEDEDKSERLVTNIESEPFVVFMQSGYIGLVVHYGFYVIIWLIVRRMKYSKYLLSVIVFFAINGLAGCAGLYRPEGVYLVGLVLGAVLLANNERNKHVEDTPLPESGAS